MVTKTVSFEVPFAQLSSISDRLFAAIEGHVKCGRLLEAGDRVRVAEENLKLIKPAVLWEKVGVVVLDFPNTAAADGRVESGQCGWCSTVTTKNDDDDGNGGEQRWLSKSFHLRVPTTNASNNDDDSDGSDGASGDAAGGGHDRVMEIHWLTRPSPADTSKEREPTLTLSQPAANGVSEGEDEVAVALINAVCISAPRSDGRSWRAVPMTITTANTTSTADPDPAGTTNTSDDAATSDGMQSSNEPVSINPRDTPELVPLALALGSTVGTAIALGLAQRRRQQQQQQQQQHH